MAKVHIPTNLEKQERLDFACDCLVRYRYGHQQVKALKDKFGISARNAGGWLRKARERILKATGCEKDTELAQAIGYYKELLFNEAKPDHVRMKARQRLDKILGLEIVQHRHTGPDGSPLFDPAQQQQILADPEAAEAAAKLDEALCEAQQANTRLGERNGHCPS